MPSSLDEHNEGSENQDRVLDEVAGSKEGRGRERRESRGVLESADPLNRENQYEKGSVSTREVYPDEIICSFHWVCSPSREIWLEEGPHSWDTYSMIVCQLFWPVLGDCLRGIAYWEHTAFIKHLWLQWQLKYFGGNQMFKDLRELHPYHLTSLTTSCMG